MLKAEPKTSGSASATFMRHNARFFGRSLRILSASMYRACRSDTLFTPPQHHFTMAAGDQKKALPPKIAAMRARKRQKVEQPSVAERPAKKAKTGNSKKPVRLDKLPWRDVEMPDRMDDYEGFFGLEEIDDVEVLRDEATGHVSYISRHEDNGGDSDDYPSDGEEFAGFGDEEADVPEPASVPADEVELKKGGKEEDVPEPVSVPADEVKAKLA